MPNETSTSLANTLGARLATLVQTDTDPNEFAKVATYARIHLDGAMVFRLLDTIVKDGRYVVRSNRTIDYYRDIRNACQQVLGDYRSATGEKADELAAILGWAVRLMRYYRTEEGEAELAEADKERTASQQRAGASQAASRLQAPKSPTPTKPAHPEKPAPPRPPLVIPKPVKTETRRETVSVLSVGKASKGVVKAPTGEEIACTGLPWDAEVGDKCRADVTREGGKAVRAVWKGWP